MGGKKLEQTLDGILEKDSRFHRDAYAFVGEAVDFTQKSISRANKGKVRHITGQELLAGIRAFASEQYGPMALMLFEEWGVKKCEDFGEIVFNLVEHGLLSKTENDSRVDFKGGYDFHEAFRKPFIPRRKAGTQSKLPGVAS